MDEESKKKCFLCGPDGAMALFGIVAGLVILGLSVDLIRRIRLEQNETALEVSGDE